ncbi:protein-(glutamine-N5) methyltransferase, release factor-specific, partial [Pseudomonas sp. 5S3]|nr:protein-(glutamine-N5) methyltransferase, release factor-specific [Pseudomonas sp. 5S3]
AQAVRDLLLNQGFDGVHSRIDLGGHERITLGRRPC